jgi:tRNA pseudouridine13 synthase
MCLLSGDVVDVDRLAYARGEAPPTYGTLRARPEDFCVEEDCNIALDDAGEHLWLWVEKTGLTTPRALEIVSGLTGVHPRHIGYAGLKDRHALTQQWFSLVWPIKSPLPEWPDRDDIRVLTARRHGRKLKRGAHRGNTFTLRVRDLSFQDNREALGADLERVRACGVPNYFGAQRFGRDGRNITLSRALFAGRRLSRNRRGFALSAARSLIFNAMVDARVRAGNWDRPLVGDVCMLDGSQSVFAWADAGQSEDALAQRMDRHDLHPAALLPGKPQLPATSEAAADLEADIGAQYAELIAGLAAAGVDSARRATRLLPRDFSWSFQEDDLVLSFWLPSGAFATSVLREIVQARAPEEHE